MDIVKMFIALFWFVLAIRFNRCDDEKAFLASLIISSIWAANIY